MAEKMTMTITELADTLGVSVKTIHDRRTRHPDTLPQALNIPGQKTLLWLSQDVLKWLIRFRAEPEVEAPRRGRPLKPEGPPNQRIKLYP